MKRLNSIQSQNLIFLKFFIIALLFVFLAGQTQSIWNELYHNKSAFSKISPKKPISSALSEEVGKPAETHKEK